VYNQCAQGESDFAGTTADHWGNVWRNRLFSTERRVATLAKIAGWWTIGFVMASMVVVVERKQSILQGARQLAKN